jgi:hypothetical protein
MVSMNVFLTESNVEIYLSRLHTTWNAEDRDKLLRLLVREESQMGFSREHLENGERRTMEGRDRVTRQRELVANIPPNQRDGNPHALLLVTLEQTQALLESHVAALRQRLQTSKL